MKKITNIAGILTLSTFLMCTTPIMAQTDGDNSATMQSDTDHDDNNWGWIGLIGLAGLLGLRKKDDRRTTYTTGNTGTTTR